jgi:hypothetical protein
MTIAMHDNPDKLKKMKMFRFMSECIICKHVGQPESVCEYMVAMKESDDIKCNHYEEKSYGGAPKYVR